MARSVPLGEQHGRNPRAVLKCADGRIRIPRVKKHIHARIGKHGAVMDAKESEETFSASQLCLDLLQRWLRAQRPRVSLGECLATPLKSQISLLCQLHGRWILW